MAQDGRPLVLGHELDLAADLAVGQRPQLIDQAGKVLAGAKVKRPLGNRSGRAARDRRRKGRVGRIEPVAQLPGGLGAQVDVGLRVARPALAGSGNRRRDAKTRQMVGEVAAHPQLVERDPAVRHVPLPTLPRQNLDRPLLRQNVDGPLLRRQWNWRLTTW